MQAASIAFHTQELPELCLQGWCLFFLFAFKSLFLGLGFCPELGLQGSKCPLCTTTELKNFILLNCPVPLEAFERLEGQRHDSILIYQLNCSYQQPGINLVPLWSSSCSSNPFPELCTDFLAG